jgi:hypothetical protein
VIPVIGDGLTSGRFFLRTICGIVEGRVPSRGALEIASKAEKNRPEAVKPAEHGHKKIGRL